MTQNNPLVSIVICCYNRRDLLRKTLNSVLLQNYEPVEIIVVDDGSVDGTEEMVRQSYHEIKYFRQENAGISAARTHGCQKAKGRYIAFQDDDDLMPENRIVTLMSALRSCPDCVLAVGDWMEIDENDSTTGNRWLPENVSVRGPQVISDGYEAILWPRVPAVPHTTLFERSVGTKVGWFDERLRYASEDKDFFARVALEGSIVYVPEIVSYYRRGHASLTNNSLTVYSSMVYLFQKHLRAYGGRMSSHMHNRVVDRMILALLNIKAATGNHGTNVLTLEEMNDVYSLMSPKQRVSLAIRAKLRKIKVLIGEKKK